MFYSKRLKFKRVKLFLKRRFQGIYSSLNCGKGSKDKKKD